MGVLLLFLGGLAFCDLFAFVGIFIADSSYGSGMCFLAFVLLTACLVGVYYLMKAWYNSDSTQAAIRKQEEEERKIIEQERQTAIWSNEAGAPWQVRYATYPCPYCGHYKVRSAKWEDKRMSVAFWGAASSKIGTQFKCEHCNRMW